MGSLGLIIDEVTLLVEPILRGMSFELVDAEYLSKNSRWVLRLFIDKEGGVTIDDCARVSREIGTLIDVKGIINREYVLEVSSPGLNRPLKKEKDFVRAIGKKVKVTMVTPVGGQRNFTGYLEDFKDKMLYLAMENETVELSWASVGKANLVYEF